MNIEIEKEGKLENSPLSKEKIIELIESMCLLNLENDQVIEKILESLNKHSSLFKYIVTVTTFNIDSLIAQSNENLKIDQSFGASWSPKKDGLFNYVLTSENEEGVVSKSLITIIWILK